MTAQGVSGFSRITVSAPTTTVDLALPAAAVVLTLLPDLLAAVDIGMPADVDRGPAATWALCRVDGSAVDVGATVDANGIRDGDLLVLQPARGVPEPPIYDDIVEVIADPSLRPGWSARTRRAAALAGGSGALAVLLAVTATSHGTGRVAVCAVVPVALLACARLLVRGGHGAATTVLSIGVPAFAALGGWSAAAGLPFPSRLLVAGLAALVVAVPLRVVLGSMHGDAPAAGTVVVGASTVAAALVMTFGGAGSGRATVLAMAVVGPLALVTTTALATVSLRWARVPGPRPVDGRPASGAAPDSAELATRVRAAQRLLTGSVSGALAVSAAASIVLVSSRDRWSGALAVALAMLITVRARLFAALAPSCAALGCAAVSWAGIVGTLVARSGGTVTGVMQCVSGAAVLGAVAAVGGAGRWAPSPRLHRAVDVAETMLLVATGPLALGVWGGFGALAQVVR